MNYRRLATQYSDQVNSIGVDDLHDAVIIDVRGDDEVIKGMIDGAIHIPLEGDSLDLTKLENIDKNQKIVVYCAAGVRSIVAAYFLQNNDFTNVCSLKYGFISYKR